MKKLIIPSILFLLVSCGEKSKGDKYLFPLENNLHMDNYYLFRSNQNYFKAIAKNRGTDSLKNDKNYDVAVKLNEINDKIDNEFRQIRAEFIANLNGNNLLEIADTIKLEQLVNKDDTDFTNKYYNDKFIAKLNEVVLIETELNNLSSDCDLGSIKDIWPSNKLTAKEFIINLTLTENNLDKKINCLYNRINIE